MIHDVDRRHFLGFSAATTLIAGCGPSATPQLAPAADPFAVPPMGFTSGMVRVNGTDVHYVRGGTGPALLLVHGMPEDWTEYRAVMPRLARRFTVVSVDIPGIGRSAPAANGYDAASLAADLQAMMRVLRLEQPYIVGHDLGGIVTYAYVRRFPETLRGAMILDVPMPGIAGWEEATDNHWHIGFIQAPGQLAERLMSGRQAIYFEQDLASARFTPEQRTHYVRIYGDPQLHAAFEIYRGFPRDGEYNSGQTGANNVPLLVAVGERSPFNSFLDTFVEGYRAKGMARVEGARIPGASHFVVADNPERVSELIERAAG